MIADSVFSETAEDIIPVRTKLLDPGVHELHHLALDFRVAIVEIWMEAVGVGHYLVKVLVILGYKIRTGISRHHRRRPER